MSVCTLPGSKQNADSTPERQSAALSVDNVRVTDRQAEDERFLELRHRNEMKGTDNVNHPPHYNNGDAKCACGRRIECIDVTRHLSFNIGNAIKYLWRCDFKGSSVEDLRKAAWYIQDEIKKRI